MPLQPHALGVTVAEVTAHPNRELGVALGMGERGTCTRDTGDGSRGCNGAGFRLRGGRRVVIWSEGPSSLRSPAKLCKHALRGRRLQKSTWCGEDFVAGAVRRRGGARCSDPNEQDGPRWPQKDDKEREESRWMESVRD